MNGLLDDDGVWQVEDDKMVEIAIGYLEIFSLLVIQWNFLNYSLP